MTRVHVDGKGWVEQPDGNPRSIWSSPPWRGPGAHVADEFTSGNADPDALAERLAAHGFQWSAIEDLPNERNDADGFITAYFTALAARKLRSGIWLRGDVQQASIPPTADRVDYLVDKYRPDFVGLDVEVWPLYQPDIAAVVAERHPSLPRVVIVAGMPPPLPEPGGVDWQVWVRNGWDCMTEAYCHAGPPIVGGMDVDAYWRGFGRNAVPPPPGWTSHDDGPHTWPLLELNAESCPGFAVQAPSIEPWGPHFSLWSPMYWTDADWQAAGDYIAQHA